MAKSVKEVFHPSRYIKQTRRRLCLPFGSSLVCCTKSWRGAVSPRSCASFLAVSPFGERFRRLTVRLEAKNFAAP